MSSTPEEKSSEKTVSDARERASEFEQSAAHAGGNLVGDLWHLLNKSKKWWLLPILLLLLLFGGLILLSGTAMAPFIYTLF